MSFIPNLVCYITKQNGYNVYGEKAAGARTQTKCGLVRLKKETTKTSVRADTSGSGGNAEEMLLNDSRLLFLPTISIGIGDMVEVSDMVVEIRTIFPRYNIIGKLDHYECDGKIYLGY
jgi:hypothetical protein